jgi:hypothetical protein
MRIGRGAAFVDRRMAAVANSLKAPTCPPGRLAGIFHPESDPLVRALFWRRDALVAFSRDGSDEGFQSP